jgi:hypothetical protein
MNDTVKILLVVTITTMLAMAIGYGMIKLLKRSGQNLDSYYLGIV